MGTMPGTASADTQGARGVSVQHNAARPTDLNSCSSARGELSFRCSS